MEQSAPPPPYPANATFSELLAWHLFTRGTRPNEVPGEPNSRKKWLQKEFALALVDENHTKFESSYSKLSQWLRGDKKPAGKSTHLQIKSLLFNFSPQHQIWARELLDAPKALYEPSKKAEALAPEGKARAVSEIPQAVSEFLNLFRQSDLYKKSIEHGISEDIFADAASNIASIPMDESEREVEILLKIIKSDFDYQQQFAFEELCHFEKLSNRAIDFIFRYISSHSPSWATSLQDEFFDGSLNEEKKKITAFSIIQSHNPIERIGGLSYLCKQDTLPRKEAIKFLADKDESVKEIVLNHCKRKAYFDDTMVPHLLNMLSLTNKNLSLLAFEMLVTSSSTDFLESMDRKERYAFQAIAAANSWLWPALIKFLSGKIQKNGNFLLPLVQEVAQSSDRRLQDMALDIIPEGREQYVANLVRDLASFDDESAVRAAYRLGYSENRSDYSLAALDSAALEHRSTQVRIAASLALRRQRGEEASKGKIHGSNLCQASGVYPIHEIVASVGNERGLDIRPIANLMHFADRFKSESYIKSRFGEGDYEKLKQGSPLDIYAATLASFRDCLTFIATGPDAIECLESIKKFVEWGMYDVKSLPTEGL